MEAFSERNQGSAVHQLGQTYPVERGLQGHAEDSPFLFRREEGVSLSCSWVNTSSDRFRNPDEFSLSSILIAAMSFSSKTNFAKALEISSIDLDLLELTNLS